MTGRPALRLAARRTARTLGWRCMAIGLVMTSAAICPRPARAAPVDDEATSRSHSVAKTDEAAPETPAPVTASPVADDNARRTGEEALDEIHLRDGREIRGRIVERAPGRWVVVETEDGRRRTFAWDTIVEIDAAANARPAVMTARLRAAWEERSGGGATWEVRANLSTLSLPARTFRLGGTCSTGSGEASVAMYGQTASDGALGFGGGVGGRLGYMYRVPLHGDSASSWWGFRAGLGLDVAFYQMHTPIGLPAMHGELCTEIAKSSYDLRYESSSLMLVQVPLNVGGHLAFGKVEDARWSGIVLGAAWTPSFIHAGAFSSTASSHLNPLGLELNVDFAVLHALPFGRPPEPQLRFSLFLAPHTTDSQPAIGTLSVGAVWY